MGLRTKFNSFAYNIVSAINAGIAAIAHAPAHKHDRLREGDGKYKRESDSAASDMPTRVYQSVNGVTTDSDGSAPNTSAQETALTKAPSRLFALLIGINTYNGSKNTSNSRATAVYSPNELPTFNDLRGAVPDAEQFHEYLITDLQVPQSHITFLRDKEATRERIIKAFQELSTNEKIQKGDSIFIFYAGHGAQAYPPKRLIGTPGCPERVELLVPHDYHKDPANVQNMGIPDYSLAALLNKIAKEKGDNITIVFDCCHSASALRGSKQASSQEETLTRSGPELDYNVPDDLDEDIWGPRTRGLMVPPTLKHLGTSSYVFLAACTSSQMAKEKSSRGCFTQALLAYLKTQGPKGIKVPCSQVMNGLQKIDGQNPQCEGLHSETRPIFHGYTPSLRKHYFDVQFDPRRHDSKSEVMTLKAGEVHGLCEGNELIVYARKLPADLKQPIGTVVIDKVSVATSSLKFKPGSPTFSSSKYPQPVAVLSKSNAKQQRLAIYVDPIDSELVSRVEDIGGCTLQKDLKDAHIHLSSVITAPSKKQLRFKVVDAELIDKGIELMPRFISDTEEDLTHVLKGLTHYYYHLKRTSTSLATDKISFSLFEVQDKGYGHPRVDRMDSSSNLCKDGLADIKVAEGVEAIYGVEVTNNIEQGGKLFPVLLYFDNVDFTISRSFPHTVLGGNTESPWPATGQSMTIGYGVGPGSNVQPFSFYLSEGNDVEAGFFKLFLFETPVDLQSVEQEESVFVKSRGMKAAKLSERQESTSRWGSITVAVIQRR